MAHVAVALGALHAVPHPPHRMGLVRVSASQPFIAFMSQSAKPASQVTPQVPIAHVAVARAPAGQALPQRPQFAALVAVFASQPLAAIMSQSPKPALHIATVQAPAAQPAVPLAAMQVFPHVPQFIGFICVSWHIPPQHDCPIGHGLMASHPMEQAPPMHSIPIGHWSLVTHPTHMWVMVLHLGVAGEPAQPSSARQPATQAWVMSSQCWAGGQLSDAARQTTHIPLAVSHTEDAGVPAQSGLLVQRTVPSPGGVPVSCAVVSPGVAPVSLPPPSMGPPVSIAPVSAGRVSAPPASVGAGSSPHPLSTRAHRSAHGTP
jgi:hypothetical protein